MITVYVNLDERTISTHIEKNMQIKVNTLKCSTEKEFKDNLAKIIKGKSTKKEVPVVKWVGAERAITINQIKEVYTPYKIEEIAFESESDILNSAFVFDGRRTNFPTQSSVSWTAIQMFGLCLANNIYATFNGRKVDGDLLNQIQDIRTENSIDKAYHNNIYRLMSTILSSGNKQLFGLYLSCMENQILDIERFIFELQIAIKKSGYDVEMSTESYTEGRMTYKFYDGSQHVEGCKSATKKYIRYTTQAIDLVNMYINIKYYESIGMEPELTTQRHNTIGLANSWRFVDEDELESFIESEMRSGEAEDYEEQTHIYNATVDMLFS